MEEEIAKLPSLDHFRLADAQQVYEPAEDTYLLCDALSIDRQAILAMKPTIVLEVGSGSGCVITYLSQLLHQELNYHSFVAYATDINPNALLMTQKTAKANHVHVETIRTRFVDAIEQTLQHNIDILIFNPPYVPSEQDELGGCGIEAAWAGGVNGREVIDVFLPYIPKMISSTGCCYLVLVKENKPEEIRRILLQSYQLESKYINKVQARNEELHILKIFHPISSK